MSSDSALVTRLGAAVERIHSELIVRSDRGRLYDDIPQLKAVDPRQFGLAVADLTGRVWTAGGAEVSFSIQSISKIFTLALALNKVGEQLWSRVGREPSGSPFNSIVQLESERGLPRNPFINAGALTVADCLIGLGSGGALNELLSFIRLLSAADISIDECVKESEASAGYRNAALANFLKAHGNLSNSVQHVLDFYFGHCAIQMTCRELATSCLFLANSGKSLADRAIVSPDRARRICSLMMTCGHYDGSGEFAFRVGLPAKSGVGGGIVAIVSRSSFGLRMVARLERKRNVPNRSACSRGSRSGNVVERVRSMKASDCRFIRMGAERTPHLYVCSHRDLARGSFRASHDSW